MAMRTSLDAACGGSHSSVEIVQCSLSCHESCVCRRRLIDAFDTPITRALPEHNLDELLQVALRTIGNFTFMIMIPITIIHAFVHRNQHHHHLHQVSYHSVACKELHRRSKIEVPPLAHTRPPGLFGAAVDDASKGGC